MSAQAHRPALHLRDQARLGVSWNLALSTLQEGVQFGVTIILARLLTPAHYGKYALVLAIIGFMNAFSFQSFLDHSLQVRRDEDADFQGHFSFGAYVQIGLFFLANVVAFGLRFVPSQGEISPLLHTASLVFLLSWPSSVRAKMLERALEWRRLRGLQAIAVVGSAVLAVLMAALGAGVYALILPGWLKHVVLVHDLFRVKKWRPAWSWEPRRYLPALRFGMSRMASAFLTRGRQLAESTFFVPVVGYASLGLFNRAVGLAQITCLVFSSVLLQSIYPILTKIAPASETSARTASLVLRTVSWFVVPSAAAVAALAHLVIIAIYGRQWVDAIPLLPWAMMASAAGAVSHAAYMLLLANQKESHCLRLDGLLLAGTVVLLGLLLPYGITSYLGGVALLHGLSVTLALSWLARAECITFGGIATALAPPALSAMLAFGVAHLALSGASLTESLLAGASFVLLFAVVYAGALRLLFAPSLKELVNYFPAGPRLNRFLFLKN